MPFSGGGFNTLQTEIAARKRVKLESELVVMEERYQLYVQTDTAHYPHAKVLKQRIDALKHQLKGS